MPLPLKEIPEQTPPDELDEEILEIFLEEVGEVKEEIAGNYAEWKDNPGDKEALANLRRAFHTLKGSGRLVGAMAIGELGWAFESMLNKVIEGTLSRNSDMLKLIDQVDPLLPVLLEEFQSGTPAGHPLRLLISQAHHLTESKGKSLGEFEGLPEGAAAAPARAEPVAEEAVPELAEAETEEAEEAFPALEEAPEAFAGEAEAEEEFAFSAELPELETGALEGFAETAEEGLGAEFELPAELPELETGAQYEFAETAEERLGAEFELPAELPELETGAQDEFAEAAALAAETEAPEELELPAELAAEEEEAVDPGLLAIYRNEAVNHLNNLKTFLVNCRKQAPCKATPEIVRTLHTLNGSSRSVRYQGIASLAALMESYLRGCQEHGLVLKNEVVALLVESGKLFEAVLKNHGEVSDPALHAKLLKGWEHLNSTLPALESEAAKAAARAAEAEAEAELAAAPKTTLKPEPPPAKASQEVSEVSPEAADEFMEIFLEEAEEILETSQSLVGKWLAAPNNMPLIKELQRELHTLKGGSRMVGISQMGDLSHQLESVLTKIVEGNAQSNPRLQGLVQDSLDELAAMLEAVRGGVGLEPATDLIRQINAAIAPGGAEADLPPPPKHKPAAPETIEAAKEVPTLVTDVPAPPPKDEEDEERPAAPAETGEGEERIRVRAALIDKLTNLAGEMAISRAHMEQQHGALKGNLVEMDQTVMRLRDLLRRLEIETEVQILAHFREVKIEEPSGGEEFDALEMDRFSVMQQLSRSLMETVSDLVNIQEQMRNLLRHSDSLLIQQSRIGAELQDGIMRTRMVPFAQITPRLQRISRLTSKELHKQVEFKINDESIEFERTVLNRIVAPLEHLLRNAIGHGVELPEERQRLGKPPQATIGIELYREGAELILCLSDDGAGLDFDAIRAKAVERGMLKEDTKVSERELSQFILEPAFSTAKTITQVSGRGVGMDIVNSEVKQLGGTLQIFSRRGKGTSFEIRLPLSLTISQALLVHLGEETLAVPLPNVDAVLRVPRSEVEVGSAEDIRHYRYMDHDYRIFHLGDMLGLGRGSVDTSLLPMLLVRSADQRLALLVDGVEGSREVVIKAVGPQLSAIRWIAGATILGDGRVVLILDILTLMRTNLATLQRLPVAPAGELAAAKAAIPTIMVVDDSITVRKVTARLLQRQGMEVMTAKDGVDAVAQLQEHIPDVMLLDVEMPRMDGFELATQVRNDERLKHIPIIMITSRTGLKHRERAARIGINRHLGKPFNETELLENINELLAEKRT